MSYCQHTSFFMIIILLFSNLFIDICLAELGQKTVGNWLEIASPEDPAVIEVGEFAVDQHNKDTNSSLTFERVVKGDTQIVGGMNWRLTIEVEDVKVVKTCEVLVFEQPWQNVTKLIDFKIVYRIAWTKTEWAMTHNHHVTYAMAILPLIISVLLGVSFAENGQKTVGNWLEIASPNDPMVIKVGKFAVEEHNKEKNATLKFEHVINGDTQIVGGMNWRLRIKIEDNKSIKNCEVLVYEQPWENVRKLVLFKIIE
ncbi:multicystatin-like [Bidens hawaiensis]|uniref:multicystatin-like n=1 Tax=Bidens hawaiensis TaxID=980011 RepID=UPI00404B367B